MDARLIEIYDSFVPADQQVIDIVILTIYAKQKEINDLIKHVKESL